MDTASPTHRRGGPAPNLGHLAQKADDSDDDEEAEKFPFAWFRFDNWLKSVPGANERVVCVC